MEEDRGIPCSLAVSRSRNRVRDVHENPEISAASGGRITLGAICPYLRLHLVGPRDKRGRLRIIKREQVR